MTASVAATIRERVQQIETMPAIPAVFLPLMKLLSSSGEDVKLDEVVRLVSYDGTIAGQCLRVAGSPLFGLPKAPESIKGAVLTLGLRRVETILLTCCLGQAFPAKKWVLDPVVFWRHSLGCAMVCRKFSEKLASADAEKAYMAGLLHDIGFMVNCLAFSKEFTMAMERARQEEIPLGEAELATMGFTHCETGQALAEKWKLADDIMDVIAYHHAVEPSQKARPLVALVHLSDLLCRMRGLGYGYYERHSVDLIADPAWAILLKEHRDLEGVDLVRFTFELDEAVEEIHSLVATVFGASPVCS
ncbi:MAG TPA: HDOD domain-containing protein [Terriglobales bacterium]|jgi:putative nucleotidyltransferase with HDIG domain|nr:HDOD domain-containing protein [Terriglobales bacterium]